VTTTDAIADQVRLRNPGLSKRVSTIPIGVPVPDHLPLREFTPGAPLRMVYQGGLIQYQKRILDLPRIVEEALRREIPVELTVIGDGADRQRLMEASSQLVERGAIRFMGLLPHGQVLKMLGQFDVFLLTSEFEGMPNALGEAMARGCVPIVTDIRSGIRELVRDGETGYVVPVGAIGQFADRLALLQGDFELRGSMSVKAREAVVLGGFSVETMVRRYRSLFDELLSGPAFQRPRGILRLPPYQVGRVKLFELPYIRVFDGVGVFPSWTVDYNGYAAELGTRPGDRLRTKGSALQVSEKSSLAKIWTASGGRRVPAWHPKLPRHYSKVAVTATSGRVSGVDIFSANLVRGLLARGREASILMTCPDDTTSDPLPLPSDVPVETLSVSRKMPWRERWKLLAQYLESNAPGIYIPNYDWRNSCISPTLSNKVGIVGIVHSDDPVHYEHATRLGKYWNAIVAVSRTIADRVIELDPTLAPRLVTIPYGVHVPESWQERSPSSALRIVYAGRLDQQQKRVRDLPIIFGALMERGIPAELTIVGGGAEEGHLKSACSRWIATGQVRFPGTLANHEVLEVFQRSDVVLLTSEFEGLPVTMLEAMAHGCVPVVTDIPSGIPELVRHGETGYRVGVGDISGFADCLAALQHDRAKLRELSTASHAAILAGGFSTEDMVSAYMNLFERVLVEAELGEYRRPKGKILPPPNSPWLHNRRRFLPGPDFARRAATAARTRFGWTSD
jgi:glycosyltransferase involved in cell wall biosynthesis